MGTASSTPEKVVVPPIAPFLPAPIVFSSPQYVLLQRLGAGAFGEAFTAVLRRDLNLPAGAALPSCRDCYDRAPNRYVVKRFRNEIDAKLAEGKTDDEKKQILAEMKQAFVQEREKAAWIKDSIGKHPNLLFYKHDIEDEKTGTRALVFEFCNCGDIRGLISGCKNSEGLIHLTLFEFLHIGSQLAAGLAALAEKKIVHRDIALRNIFVHCDEKGDLNVKLGDFGLCVDIGDRKEEERVGNGIREPAILTGFSHYDEKSDVYQLGLVLYELLSLIDLSNGTLYELDTTSLAHARVAVVGSVEHLSNARAEYTAVASIVGKMLREDASRRPSALHVHDQLSELLSSIPYKGTEPSRFV